MSIDDPNNVTDDDLSFVGIRDILSVEKAGTIRSVKGTVRGVRNRVRAGITTYLQGKTSKVLFFYIFRIFLALFDSNCLYLSLSLSLFLLFFFLLFFSLSESILLFICPSFEELFQVLERDLHSTDFEKSYLRKTISEESL